MCERRIYVHYMYAHTCTPTTYSLNFEALTYGSTTTKVTTLEIKTRSHCKVPHCMNYFHGLAYRD